MLVTIIITNYMKIETVHAFVKFAVSIERYRNVTGQL